MRRPLLQPHHSIFLFAIREFPFPFGNYQDPEHLPLWYSWGCRLPRSILGYIVTPPPIPVAGPACEPEHCLSPGAGGWAPSLFLVLINDLFKCLSCLFPRSRSFGTWPTDFMIIFPFNRFLSLLCNFYCCCNFSNSSILIFWQLYSHISEHFFGRSLYRLSFQLAVAEDYTR